MITESTTIQEMIREKGRSRPEKPDTKEVTKHLKEKVRFSFPLKWSDVEELVAQKVADLFDDTVTDVCFGAWLKLRELQALRNEKDYSPSQTYHVPLAEHEITRAPTVKLQLRVADRVISEAPLKFKVSLKLKGVLLHVKASRIRKVGGGSLSIKGSVTFEGRDIFKAETDDLEFGGTLHLREGILIPEG